MSELRVPTAAVAARLVLADGRRLSGRVFVPATAPRHEGPTRAEEWMNEGPAFFPFLPDGEPAPVLMNKQEVVVLSVAAGADAGDVPEAAASPCCRVAIEIGRERLSGVIVIDMPEGHRRVADHLNRPEQFLVLRDQDTHHLVQKGRITRVIEVREA